MPRRPALAKRSHEWLLRAYPQAYRRRFGEEMTGHFLHELDDARAAGGMAPALLWIRTVRDAAWIAAAEHLRQFAPPLRRDTGAGIRQGPSRTTRTESRTGRPGRGRRTPGGDVSTDALFALRGLRRNPTFAVAAILTIALGTGAGATALSVFEAVFVRPLPLREPHGLVQLREEHAQIGATPVRPANLVDWQERNSIFTGIAGQDVYSGAHLNLSGEIEARRVRASRVTANFFDVLGVEAAIGRTLDAADDQPGAAGSAVISHRLWVDAFDGDPSVLDRTVRLDDRRHRIVGVMPSDFLYPDQDGAQSEVWIPGAVTAETRLDRRAHTLHAVARLRPGVTLDQARIDMDRVSREIAEEHPEANRGPETGAVLLFPHHDYLVQPIRSSLIVLGGAIAFVLLISCVNLTNLLLARTEARARELAVRTAMGGDRGRVTRQLLTETFVLTLLGSLGGLVLARWLIALLLGAAPPPGGGALGLGTGAIPLLFRAHISGAVIGATLLLGLTMGTACGLVPALRGAARSAGPDRRADVAGRRASRTGAQILVVTEVALSVVLLICVGLLATAMRRISEIPVGFDPSHALVMGAQLTHDRYAILQEGQPGTSSARWVLRPAQQTVVSRTLERVAALPGVDFAGATSVLPLHRSSYAVSLHVEGQEREGSRRLDGVAVHGFSSAATVTPDYFRALGLPLLQGRPFRSQDGPSAPPVAIVNNALARALELEDPVGTRLRIRDGWGWRSVEIVGVVGDVLQFGYDPIALRDDVQIPETLYLPYAQPARVYGAFQVDFHLPVNFVVRHRGDAEEIRNAMHEIFRQVDPDTPVASSGGLSEYLEEGTAERSFLLLLMGLLASLALLLAVVGIYGVVAFQVGRRRHEIGVRMAVGAKAGGVIGMIVGEGARIGLLGALVGVALSMGGTRLLSPWLYQVSPTEPVVFVSLALLSVATGALACLLPARRAARIDPVESLKAE